jgi:putative redox protein
VTAYKAELELEDPEGTGRGFQGRLGSKRARFDSGGDPTVPTPVDSLLMALGVCAGMDVIGILRKMRQKVTAYTVEVVGERGDEHPKIFTHISVFHRVRGHGIKESAVQRAIQLSDTKYCSVHAMLQGAVQIDSRYEIIDAEASESVP